MTSGVAEAHSANGNWDHIKIININIYGFAKVIQNLKCKQKLLIPLKKIFGYPSTA